MSDAGPRAAAYCPRCGARYDPGSTFCPVDGTRLELAAAAVVQGGALSIGSVLGDRYRVVRLLGSGGMGQVYEAEHVSIQKRFALKVLRPEIAAQTEALQRFQREARAASSIGHPAIVEIEDFATLPDGTVYLAMEFLEGRTLADRLRERPLPPLAELTALMRALCRGLAAAHAHGIVHRDIKPENIFLCARAQGTAEVKILDFGIAKMNSDVSLTRTGAIFGTPRYMSPEQACGQPVDQRTDIYSVGVMLFEALVGRPPFESDTPMGMLGQHLHAVPPSPRALAPDRGIPPALEALVLATLAKDPRDRPQSMEELERRLTEASVPANVLPSAHAPPAPGPSLGEVESPRTGSPSVPPAAAALHAALDRTPGQVTSPPPPRSFVGVLKIVALTFVATIGLFAWIGTRNRQPPAAPVADSARAEPLVPAPKRDEPPRSREMRKEATKANWSGLYRNGGAVVKLEQRGERVQGVSMAGDLVAQIVGLVEGDTLIGKVSANGRSVGFRATLQKNGSVNVRYDDGQTEKLTRVKRSELPGGLDDE